jgi:AraC-like DNA-binding protein
VADPDLSPSTLARQLGVSVRTLHRAFAATQETMAGYVRRRRLERARADPLADRGSVSGLAAHWQFADSSPLRPGLQARLRLYPHRVRARMRPSMTGRPQPTYSVQVH